MRCCATPVHAEVWFLLLSAALLVQVAHSNIPNLAITSTPCQSYPVHPAGTITTVNFTVSSGFEVNDETNVNFIYPWELNLTSVVVADPTGQADFSWACPPLLPGGGPGQMQYLICSLFGSSGFGPNNNQAVFTFTFQSTAIGNWSIQSYLSWPTQDPYDVGPVDYIVPDNFADTCVTLTCPLYQQMAGGSCQTLPCTPCADEKPLVYLSTGGSAKPPNGLWQIRDFEVGNMSLVPEFLCVITGISGMVGDIAVLHKGDIAVLDTIGYVRYIPAASIPAPGTDYNATCPTLPLYRMTGHTGYTGLSNAFRSDGLLVTTADGWVTPLLLTVDANGGMQAGPLPSRQSGLPPDSSINWACWYNNSSPTSPISGLGGTDITPGPDGQFYRLCAKGSGMDYTGTRFATSLIDGYLQLGGTSGAFVSNKLSDQPLGAVASVSNAGSFCTSKFVLGVGTCTSGTRIADAASGTYALFYAYGYVNGTQTSGVFGSLANLNMLSSATLVARTAQALKPDGSPRTDALRVAGAAVKGRCP